MSLNEYPAVRSLELYQQSTYAPVAGAFLFMYDYFLTLDDEVRYMWGARWSLGKILFILTRYPTFGDVVLALYRNIGLSIAEDTCRCLYSATGWFAIAGGAVAEIVLILQVWAIWGRSRTVGVGIFAFFAGLVIGTAVIFSHSTEVNNHFTELGMVSSLLRGCFINTKSNVIFVGYLFVMVFEICMVILLLLKGVKDLHRRSSSFLYNVYRDGFAYYAIITTVSILNVIFLLSGPRELANLLVTPQRVLHSMLSVRLLLRLREDAFQQQTFDTITQTISDSIFFPSVNDPTASRWRNSLDPRS